MIDDNQISTKEIEDGKLKKKDVNLLAKKADAKKLSKDLRVASFENNPVCY